MKYLQINYLQNLCQQHIIWSMVELLTFLFQESLNS